jgi:hypothetical protein
MRWMLIALLLGALATSAGNMAEEAGMLAMYYGSTEYHRCVPVERPRLGAMAVIIIDPIQAPGWDWRDH